MNEKIKIIYIAPYGHSGSTLLDLTLNMHDKICSVGEVMFLDKWRQEDLLCTCSNRMSECQFWNEVFRHLGEEFKMQGEISKALVNLTPISFRNETQKKEYAQKTYLLFKAIQKITGVDYILDSSKVVGRLEVLATSNLFDISVIHLVRNGEAVAKSYKTPKIMPSHHNERKTKSSPVWKTSLKWYLSNMNLMRVKKRNNIKSINIRFEDFTQNPESKLSEIGDLLEIDTTNKMLNISTDNTHNIGGSRWRYQDNIEIEKSSRLNKSLNGIDKILFELLAGRMNRRFGY